MTRRLQPHGEPIDPASRSAYNDYHTAGRRAERKNGLRPYEPIPVEVTPGAVVGAVGRCGLSVQDAAELLGVPVDRCLELLTLGRVGYRRAER